MIRHPRRWLAATLTAGCCATGLISTPGQARQSNGPGTPAFATYANNPIAPDAQSVRTGKAIYAHHCAECHGASGKGDGKAGRDLDPRPSDLTNADTAEQSDASLFAKITRGRKPMPSYRKLLKDEERWHVVNYLRSLHAADGKGGRS